MTLTPRTHITESLLGILFLEKVKMEAARRYRWCVDSMDVCQKCGIHLSCLTEALHTVYLCFDLKRNEGFT